MDRRQQFLSEFLGALGASEILYEKITPDFIHGAVVYDQNDPDERQDFRWSLHEDDSPSLEIIRLTSLIRAGNLLSIDKLKVSREDLLARVNSSNEINYSSEQFSNLLDELLRIQVSMIDDGAESDWYFIHE
jgi:hypothetical protein